MVTAASENLRTAATEALASVHPLPKADAPPVTLEQVLGAVDRIVGIFTAEFEAVHRQLAESQKREDHLHECVERLIGVISETERRAEQRMLDRERAHFEQHSKLHEEIADLRKEVRGLADVLGDAAGVARTEAIGAANRAEAAERYVRQATLEVRSERPSRPGLHKTDPSDPRFESGAPEPQ